ncbi:MAG: sugar phosphate isomerase/epimerase [Deltaproteobacteria bacterium]|jgi:sugar phosphate isomerase/epimerase|nr:sugar phosphate isomerase/epimerase [Deltaproteobacteria bacterium]
MQLFATLYFYNILTENEHFQLLKRIGYFPEIYFESAWTRYSTQKHLELAKKVQNELGGCAIHLPYSGLLPGKDAPNIRETLKKATAIANLYAPIHLVGHAFYRILKDSQDSPRKHVTPIKDTLTGPDSTPNEEFIKNSLLAWNGVLEETSANLYLENTSERSPYPILAVLKELPADRTSMCLDIGHWHTSGMGHTWKNLPEWIKLCQDRLGHLHLHDNDGTSDQHLPIGKGRIDFHLLWSLLNQYGLNPSITIENHEAFELEISVDYFKDHPFKGIKKT